MTTTRADQIGELWDVYDAQKIRLDVPMRGATNSQ